MSRNLYSVNRMNIKTARKFEFFNYQYYLGPNLYLNRSALVFQVKIGNREDILPLEDYQIAIEKKLPQLRSIAISNYLSLIACTISQVNQLDLDLPINSYNINLYER